MLMNMYLFFDDYQRYINTKMMRYQTQKIFFSTILILILMSPEIGHSNIQQNDSSIDDTAQSCSQREECIDIELEKCLNETFRVECMLNRLEHKLYQTNDITKDIQFTNKILKIK